MTIKPQITAGKRSVTGKRAIFIPVLICLLAMLPMVRQTFVWLDFKFSDLLFTSLPLLNLVAGNPALQAPPVLIVNKDQTFFQRFQRDPDRSDFAGLVQLLASEEARVVAFDFIYDQAADAGKDHDLASALASFPLPLMATHFIGRGTQTFEKVDIADSAANRPPWPTPLYEPVAGKAAARALINIVADLDATVRYAPLAFHPTEMDEFLPSLGFATWIATLMDNQAASITAAAFIAQTRSNENQAKSGQQAAEQLLMAAIASAPFKFSSTGHTGLDGSARRLELQFLARLIGINYPEQAETLKSAAREIKLSNLPVSTWLQMPEQPMPIIGDYELPCLRLPFSKAPPPFRGDGIETLSMGTLIETDADRASTLLNHRNLFDLATASGTSRARLSLPAISTGSCTLTGRAVTVTGRPVSGAELLLLMPDQSFWQQAATDENGNFSLSNLPEGDCTIQITSLSKNGWQRGTCKSALKTGRAVQLPLLMLAEEAAEVRIAVGSIKEPAARVAIFGEPMPMLVSDKSGGLPIASLPQGFSISGFDEELVLGIASGTLINANGATESNQTAAVLADDNFWTLRFYRQLKVETGSNEMLISGLPSSLDTRLAILSNLATGTAQKTIDLTLLPGEAQQVSVLPPFSPAAVASTVISFDYPGLQPLNLALVNETGDSFKCLSDQTLSVPPGRYLILSELNGARGIFKNNEITHKTVFIGSALPSDQDFVVTPINFMDQGFPRMPGVNLHATLFSALTQQNFMRAVPFHSDAAPRFWPILQLLPMLPLLLVLNLVFIRAGAFWGGISVAATLTAWLGLGTVLFIRQTLLPFFFPTLLLGSFGVIRGYLAWAISRRQEQETRQTFGRFISSAVVEEILKMPGGLRPGGEKKELSVIFTDLAGFTSISEKLAPEQLTELMNEYLDEMTNILFSYGGTLDKYIGDAIMGFWNHPAPQADHAQRAVECAISMQHKLAELREKWLQRGLPKVEVRAGINSAVCMVGFIGSHIQMNFTCLGDGVNLASRLEGANKAYGTFMMISDAVHNQIDRKLISTRFLDFLAVKGKDKPVEVFEVRGYRRNEPELWLKAEAGYNDGIKLYLSRSWQEAIAAFSGVLQLLPDDGPSKVYIERCEEFKKNPPPENWDGRYILKSK